MAIKRKLQQRKRKEGERVTLEKWNIREIKRTEKTFFSQKFENW